MEDLILQFQQNITTIIHDLKMHVGQLANIASQMQFVGFRSIASQMIPNPQRRGVGIVRLQSGKDWTHLRRVRDQLKPRPNREPTPECKNRPKVFLPFPYRTVLARRFEIVEELLKLFRKVEINIPLLDAIKQVPRCAKFLKELCIQKRKKKGAVKIGGVLSTLVKHENTSAQRILPKKYQDLGIFVVPCPIGSCTFTDAMLDLEESINVMPTSIYKSLNLRYLRVNRDGDLTRQHKRYATPTRSQRYPRPNFYVLDMEDEPSGEGSTLILGQSFFMMARTKIDVHVGTL
ncbi:hypothetical protein CR513_58785, partial [Mucuna pruriens]